MPSSRICHRPANAPRDLAQLHRLIDEFEPIGSMGNVWFEDDGDISIYDDEIPSWVRCPQALSEFTTPQLDQLRVAWNLILEDVSRTFYDWFVSNDVHRAENITRVTGQVMSNDKHPLDQISEVVFDQGQAYVYLNGVGGPLETYPDAVEAIDLLQTYSLGFFNQPVALDFDFREDEDQWID